MVTELIASSYDQQLREDLDEVRAILDGIAEKAPGIIREDIRRLVSGNGKMLRPSFTTIAARYGYSGGGHVYNMAAAVELLHNATLIHDDIIDEAPVRRGKPAFHTIHGNRLALLAGDYLLSSSMLVATERLSSAGCGSLTAAVSKIFKGEINQDSEKFILNPSIRMYKKRIAGKTAVLFQLSLFLGASAAGCSNADCDVFSRIGYNIGMAFQIIDDILDIAGDPMVTGKPSGHDIKDGIYTLPVLFAVKNGDGRLSRQLKKTPYRGRTVKKIVDAVGSSSGLEKAREEARLYTERAKREISRLEEGYTRTQLASLTEKLLIRNY